MKRSAGRLAVVLVACLAAVGLAACSKSTSHNDGKPPKVAFVVANSALNFANEMAFGFRSGVRQVGGVDVEVVGPPIVDGPKQVQMFQDLTKSAKDGISVFTLSPELFAAPLSDAGRSGVPLIAVDNQPPPSSNVTLFVGNDNYQLGTMLADEVADKLPANATGKIVLGTSSPGVPVLDRRAKGMREQLKKRLPGVTVVGPFDTKQEVAANLDAWRTLVRANADALAFLGTGDADGWNLAAVRAETHGTWLAGAYDLDPRSLAAVKAGDLLLVSPEHFVKGAIAGRLQAKHAKTGAALPQGWIYTPGLAVNSSNIDAIIARQVSMDTREAALGKEVDKILGDKSYLRPLNQAG
jgi:ribose transport system substrate-binding protein